MQSVSQRSSRRHRGSLDDFLAADEIVAVPPLADADWDLLRRGAGGRLVWQFCTARNLWVHRGRFTNDFFGFAWGGIFRTLLVGSIVTTSYRNEGHFRAGERITGTGDFFYAMFVLPRSGTEFRAVRRIVNLRHHVAGVVTPCGDDDVRVADAYEADYAYVATAFIESIRRGLALCGLRLDSARGRSLGAGICRILYQVAGFTGLARMPRDLAAHERFRDAYDRRLREAPPSPRIRRMAREIARRIAPATASKSGETVRGHVGRHLDPETAEFLFPGGVIPAELEPQRRQWHARHASDETRAAIRRRIVANEPLWRRADVAALFAAYRQAGSTSTDARLIGSILLHALDAGAAAPPLERRTLELAADEPLIRQGASVGEMYVVLSTNEPLVVLHAAEPGSEPRLVATLAAPTVLGEIGMWRGRPAVATVLARRPNRLELLVIDGRRFESLKQEPGFRAATAAEVQRRLALNTAVVGTRLDDAAASSDDPRLASIAQLFRYLSGDSHGRLDAVIDLPDEATPAECVEALREQVDAVIRDGTMPADLVRHLDIIMATIG